LLYQKYKEFPSNHSFIIIHIPADQIKFNES
jgi:hypothetical protein